MSDFRADVTSGKWQNYLQYACGVYFACEGDLIKKADVPTHCGLTVFRNGVWRAAKKAVLSPVIIPQEALLKLVIDGVEREGSRHRQKYFQDSVVLDKIRSNFGALVGQAVRDRLAVEYETDQARRDALHIEKAARLHAEKIKNEASIVFAPVRAELCEILGLPTDARQLQIASEVRRIKQELTQHPAHKKLKALTDSIRWALAHHGYLETSVIAEQSEELPTRHLPDEANIRDENKVK